MKRKDSLIKVVVRMMFFFTSRKKASHGISKQLAAYLQLAQGISEERGAKQVKVPLMPGVDRDMRNWSFFMLLEHNTIVNYRISAIVRGLALNEKIPGLEDFNPKRDVLPSKNPGFEQIELFKKSIDTHLQTMTQLPRLRGTATQLHPIFGDFDAHRWNCMFGFHLALHLKQAKLILAD